MLQVYQQVVLGLNPAAIKTLITSSIQITMFKTNHKLNTPHFHGHHHHSAKVDRVEISLKEPSEKNNNNNSKSEAKLTKPLVVYIDGPFGAPTSQIFRAQHAVLIGK